ncbi:DsbA family protein [Martelella alba]|uniref:DsbA family protein n=1 Tax=Martelella alba TaxID=2590451 RepID=A0ABY2SJR2_9HYPH|nr:DsbA family protein [Martelella alba]TKI04327.1 DsbA family protein [Martelella alba]
MTRKLRYAVLATVLSFTSQAGLADTPAQAPFTPAQQEAIGKIAADYLLAHPEILVQVSQKLQEQQAQEQAGALLKGVLDNQAALLGDKDTPTVGPEQAKVAVIEFFDYQCIYCSHMAPIMESVMKANSDVKFIFKEWPIFGGRWQPSITAAETGLNVWKTQGPKAYLAYHNGIYKTGHNEGKLTDADINGVLKQLHVPPAAEAVLQKNDAVLSKINQLAQQIGFSGTPGFVIMPTSGADKDNVTVFAGAVDQQDLQDAIKKAGGK